jgi:hypothetical protein
MEALEAEVWGRFRRGGVPSDIDDELHLPRGTAHDIVCHHWAVEKESRHHGTEYGGDDDLIGA